MMNSDRVKNMLEEVFNRFKIIKNNRGNTHMIYPLPNNQRQFILPDLVEKPYECNYRACNSRFSSLQGLDA